MSSTTQGTLHNTFPKLVDQKTKKNNEDTTPAYNENQKVISI